MADFISSPSLFSMTPSPSISSIMTSSSSSVMVLAAPSTLLPMYFVSFPKIHERGDRMISTALTTPTTRRT